MIFFYNIFVAAYRLGVKIAATRNPKAAEWVAGRQRLWQELDQQLTPGEPLIWIHSSSAGEFEQAKPVIERLKALYPSYKVLVTFFSPSGYNAARRYQGADFLFYLPDDTAAHAERFLQKVRPALVVFVKYDFWFHHLQAVHRRNIPLLLVSAVFRPGQSFFKWYGGFYRNMLHFFTRIFVQDPPSLQLLQQHGISHGSISGDTRFDRVAEIAEHFTEVPFVADFAGTARVIVAGSTWSDDEAALLSLQLPPDCKLIVAPHEIDAAHIEKIEKEFPAPVRYSQLKAGAPLPPAARTLIIDNVGMLSRIYKYATLTYVGGGFTRDGIHNTLEAAVYGRPVLFGPNYEKYREAKELIAAGGGFSFGRAEELQALVQRLLSDEDARRRAAAAALHYIRDNQGATEAILDFIYEKRLLTR
ncbi:glycosyltransferase N-terminal domain-containing protein [Paraflavisolibacter sp. H34]|uniref:3-deoxy-D-manno-octulosonic acid transferase n=1 Tax=Huijunlia imazamoxiresistens TaxID=3127457 RepID=UPI003017E6A4